MKQNKKFWKAYFVIMEFIDYREDTRGLFHELFNLGMEVRNEEKKE